ncbi:hypothetical protein [Nocardia cyriacigeorgica]|uniref:Uncharacterized protein n=1 Tax=Nocardia cyriacigeorgica TaxID=135487 RepID=A0A5R8NBJ8_9NOCA|nr:hypothetical protein [Nocardia cyriacigeorgica]TLF72883.1 hypothetical protein FEK34_28075 [Nocardia cyriacigeorgica]
MSHIVFWSEPDVVKTDDAFVTSGAGEVSGGADDGAERIAIVIHHGENHWGRAHLTAPQARTLIESLTAACAALDVTPDGAV